MYATVVSTEADAMSWARAGAPEGSVVVAQNQISARCRPRRPWPTGDAGFSFTLVLHPDLPPIRAGILHLAATGGIADVLGPGASIEWPDEVYLGERLAALVSVHAEQTVRGLEWALVNVMLTEVPPPRAPVLARVVEAIELRYRQPADQLVAEWAPRCRTIGRSVAARLYPIGRDVRVSGRAVAVRGTGGLTLLDEATGRERAVRPHELAAWEN